MIRPLGNKVVLEKFGVLTSVSSTLFTAPAYEKDHWEYRVVAVGSKVPPEIKPGFRLIASPWVGITFEHEGHELRLVEWKECQMLIGVTP